MTFKEGKDKKSNYSIRKCGNNYSKRNKLHREDITGSQGRTQSTGNINHQEGSSFHDNIF